jgi:hypothetical protein
MPSVFDANLCLSTEKGALVVASAIIVVLLVVDYHRCIIYAIKLSKDLMERR